MSFKKLSEAEEIIGDILFEIDIKYEAQKEIHGLINDSKDFRIADFYLPDFKTYLEFLGNWNDQEGQKEYREKMRVYGKNNIPCIYIWSDNLGILNLVLKERLRKELLKHKKYWTLIKFEIKEYIRRFISELLIPLMIFLTFVYLFRDNVWIVSLYILIIILIIITPITYYKNIKRRHKRIKERYNIN